MAQRVSQNRPVLLDSRGNPMRFGGTSAFRGAGGTRSQALASWTPPLTDADSTHRFARDAIVARARDLYRNTPIARSMVDGDVARGVGAGWRLRSKPDHQALQISFEQAARLGAAIETNFRLWSNDAQRRCDAQRRRTFAKIMRLLWIQRRTDGESLAVLRNRDDGGRFSTCVQVVSTDRLINRNRVQDTDRLRAGVHLDAYGAPIAYDILNGHPNDFYAFRKAQSWITVPRTTTTGRPIVIHGFRDAEPDQTRGVSPFAPVLETFRMTDKYVESEIASAVIGATIGAFVKSGFDPATVAQSLGNVADVADSAKGWQDIRLDHYEENPVLFGDVRIPVMPPGDELILTNASRDTGPFAEFVKTAYQMTAAALGQAYPEAAQNWEGMSYSTLRGMYNTLWDKVVVDRADFSDDTVFPIFYAVTEEGFARGYIETPEGAPDFWDMPEAYLSALWIGPGQKHIDPIKGYQASEIGLDANLTSLEEQAAQQGHDWRDLIDQRSHELAYMAERGVTPHDTGAALAVTAPSDQEAAPPQPAPSQTAQR